MMLQEVQLAAQPDYLPAILSIVGVLVGGLLAWVASLVGAAKEAQREHARWLRERRVEAALDFVAVVHVAAWDGDLDDLGLARAMAAVESFGPPDVLDEVANVMEAFRAIDPKADLGSPEYKVFLAAAQKFYDAVSLANDTGRLDVKPRRRRRRTPGNGSGIDAGGPRSETSER